MYLFFIFFLFLLYFINISVQPELRLNKKILLTPLFFFYTSTFLYIVALPLSRFIFNSGSTNNDLPFLIQSGIQYISISLGALFFYSIKKNIPNNTISAKKPIRNINAINFLIVCIFFLVMFFKFKALNFDFINLFAQYGLESQLRDGESLSTFDNVQDMLLIGSLIYGYIITSKKYNIFLFLAFVFIVFILLRGSRNFALILLLPILSIYYKEVKFSKFKVIIFLLLIITGGYFIGIVRNLGFNKMTDLQIESKAFDPLNQEFGTGFNVYSKYNEISKDQLSCKYGYTYIVMPFVNLVPKALWGNRPPGPAIEFSMSYFKINKENDLEFGLGYSPLVECITNFSNYGVPFFFFLFSLFFHYICYQFKNTNNPFYESLYFVLSPIIINYNRIDFATTFKMFIVLAVSFFLIHFFATIRIPRIKFLYGR
jgi:oligosaccharide repeat unit polymerase